MPIDLAIILLCPLFPSSHFSIITGTTACAPSHYVWKHVWIIESIRIGGPATVVPRALLPVTGFGALRGVSKLWSSRRRPLLNEAPSLRACRRSGQWVGRVMDPDRILGDRRQLTRHSLHRSPNWRTVLWQLTWPCGSSQYQQETWSCLHC